MKDALRRGRGNGSLGIEQPAEGRPEQSTAAPTADPHASAGPSPAARLLGRLEAVCERGPGRWLARCPAHADRTPSLAIRERKDGALLVHCFAGCAAEEVCHGR